MSNIVNFLEFDFHGNIVRIEDRECNIWLVAKDICDVLGLTDVSKTCECLDEDEKDTITIRTLGGPQKSLIISESGYYKIIFKSRKPVAKEFQNWLAKEVIPSIRKTGSYSAKPLSQIEIILQSAQILADQEKRLNKFEQRLDTIESRSQDAEHNLMALPEPSIEAPNLTTRDMVNLRVREFCTLTNSNYRSVWSAIYRDFGVRYHINLYLRSKNRGMQILDYVESIDMLEELYSIVSIKCKI